MTPAEYTVESVRILRECETKGRSLQNAAAILNWTPQFTKRICDKHAIRLPDVTVTPLIPAPAKAAPRTVPAPPTQPAKRPAGKPRIHPDVCLANCNTRLLPGTLSKLDIIASERGIKRADLLREIIERGVESEFSKSSPVASA